MSMPGTAMLCRYLRAVLCTCRSIPPSASLPPSASPSLPPNHRPSLPPSAFQPPASDTPPVLCTCHHHPPCQRHPVHLRNTPPTTSFQPASIMLPMRCRYLRTVLCTCPRYHTISTTLPPSASLPPTTTLPPCQHHPPTISLPADVPTISTTLPLSACRCLPPAPISQCEPASRHQRPSLPPPSSLPPSLPPKLS